MSVLSMWRNCRREIVAVATGAAAMAAGMAGLGLSDPLLAVGGLCIAGAVVLYAAGRVLRRGQSSAPAP